MSSISQDFYNFIRPIVTNNTHYPQVPQNLMIKTKIYNCFVNKEQIKANIYRGEKKDRKVIIIIIYYVLSFYIDSLNSHITSTKH